MRDGLGKDWTYKSFRSASGAVGLHNRGQERFGVTPTEFIRRQGQVPISVDPEPTATSSDAADKITLQQSARNFRRRGTLARSLVAENVDGPIGPAETVYSPMSED